MKVYLNKITGFEDAIVSLLMSKRSWTREKEMELRNKMSECIDCNGFVKEDKQVAFNELFKAVEKYGIKHRHVTLVRFIDLSFTVEGLHRGAQDDFDSHAKRLDNRIVRASTRLAKFQGSEKSDYYKDKILTTEEVIDILGITLPNQLVKDNKTYVKTVNGYVLEGLENDNDTLRGLYRLSIPSNFIFKVQYPELCHIVQHRDKHSFANPELRDMIEQLKVLVFEANPMLGLNLTTLKQQPK